jgi:hypothetical protein
MTKEEGDYLYEVWRRGGNPDAVNLDEIPQDYDWLYAQPLAKHLSHRHEETVGEGE